MGSKWSGTLFRHKIINGLAGEYLSWNIPADPIDEPDGGTFYSEYGTYDYIELNPQVSRGFYICPGYDMSIQGTATSFLEFYNSDKELLVSIPQGHLICDDAIASSWSRAYEYEIELDEPAYWARFKIIGDGTDLYWDGGGSLTLLQ
jgi:hypothetical protein